MTLLKLSAYRRKMLTSVTVVQKPFGRLQYYLGMTTVRAKSLPDARSSEYESTRQPFSAIHSVVNAPLQRSLRRVGHR